MYRRGIVKSGLVAAVTPAILFACGAKTGLLSPSGFGDDGGITVRDDGEIPQEEDAGHEADVQAANVLCSTNLGPVSTCDAGPDAGNIQRCNQYQRCLYATATADGPGQWWCCNYSLTSGDPTACFPPLAYCQ